MLLCAVAVIATLALELGGRLEMYIHPRYTIFTIVLVAIGAVFLLAVTVTAWSGRGRIAADERGHHEHDHGEHASPRAARRRRLGGLAAGMLVAAAATALLVVPPASLSADRATAALTVPDAAGRPAPALVGSDPTRFSVRDWATILAQGQRADDLVGQRADVSGFVLFDPATPDIAYVGRYAITCCAVDAQLFSIPVARAALPPGVSAGDWVHVTGGFSDGDGTRTRLQPDSAERIEEPRDPYIS